MATRVWLTRDLSGFRTARERGRGMGRAGVLQGVRQVRFEGLLELQLIADMAEDGIGVPRVTALSRCCRAIEAVEMCRAIPGRGREPAPPPREGAKGWCQTPADDGCPAARRARSRHGRAGDQEAPGRQRPNRHRAGRYRWHSVRAWPRRPRAADHAADPRNLAGAPAPPLAAAGAHLRPQRRQRPRPPAAARAGPRWP